MSEKIENIILYAHRLFYKFAHSSKTERKKILDEVDEKLRNLMRELSNKKLSKSKRKNYEEIYRILAKVKEQMLALEESGR